MINIEIWASGGGTNADAIAYYFAEHSTISLSCIGCNRREAGVFAVAQKHALPTTYWDKDSWNTAEILKQLKLRKIDFIVLAGFLKLCRSSIFPCCCVIVLVLPQLLCFHSCLEPLLS